MDKAVLIIGIIYLCLFFFIIVFDIAMFNDEKRRKRKREKQITVFYYEAHKDFLNKNASPKEKEKYLERFSKELSDRSALSSFNGMLKRWQKADPAECEEYIHNLGPLFSTLARKYGKKIHVSRGYFAYFLSRYDIDIRDPSNIDSYRFLLRLCGDKSMYNRENAFKAIVKSGNVALIKQAFKISMEAGIIINSRVVEEGLYLFPGNPDKLVNDLLFEFPSYSSSLRIGILNYMRRSTPNFKDVSLRMLSDATSGEEIDFASLRYLKRYPYPKALPTILKRGNEAFLAKRYEMVAVVANALASYPSKESAVFLMKALVCPLFVARKNAADSLIVLYPKHALNLAKRMHDRFAVEMVKYRLANNELEEEEKD